VIWANRPRGAGGRRATVRAARLQHQVGQGAVMRAVGRCDNGSAAEVKIRVPRIAEGPVAGLGGKCDDLFGGGSWTYCVYS
jgi:hypothetical protein